MSLKKGFGANYHSMCVFALIVGAFSIALQFFIADFDILAFMLSAAAIGGLSGGANGYQQQDRQQLERSYKTVFEWLLLLMMFAYALIVSAMWLPVIAGQIIFLNGHWPGLTIAAMCLLMGLAGFKKRELAME